MRFSSLKPADGTFGVCSRLGRMLDWFERVRLWLAAALLCDLGDDGLE